MDEALRLMRMSKASLFDDEAHGGGAEAMDTGFLKNPGTLTKRVGVRSRMWMRRCGSCA